MTISSLMMLNRMMVHQVISNATDLQVNTTRLVPDGSDLDSPLIDSGANQGIGRDDTLFIRMAIQNKVKTANPFNISRLLSDQQWNGKNGETDNYCPEPVHPTSTSTHPPPRDGNNNNNSTSVRIHGTQPNAFVITYLSST